MPKQTRPLTTHALRPGVWALFVTPLAFLYYRASSLWGDGSVTSQTEARSRGPTIAAVCKPSSEDQPRGPGRSLIGGRFLIVVLSAFGGITACGGSGGSSSEAAQTTPMPSNVLPNETPTPAQPALPIVPPVPPDVPPVPQDLPPVPPIVDNATSVCPAAGASNVGVNTHVSIDFAEGVAPDSVVADTVAVSCANGAIAGTSAPEGNRVVFVPAVGMPKSAACSASVATPPRGTSGRTLTTPPWTFSTGDVEGRWFNFSEPAALPLVAPQGYFYMKGVAADGDKVAVAWSMGATLFVALSADSGRTFDTAQLAVVNGFGTVEEFDMLIHDGVVHLAWRVLPTNYNAEVLYARSNADFTGFETPWIISDPYDDRLAMSASVTVDDDDNAYIAWQEDCDYCDSDEIGVFLATLPANPSLEPTIEHPYPGAVFTPRVAWINDRLVLNWVDADNLRELEFYDYTDHLQHRATISMTGTQTLSDYFESQGDSGVIFWREGHGQEKNLYTARYDGGQRSVTPPRRLVVTPGYPEMLRSGFASATGRSVIWAIGSGGGYEEEHYAGQSGFKEIRRSISFSDDGGDTFFAPQPLPFMSTNSFASNAVDDVVPSVAVTSEQVVYVAWHRRGRNADSHIYFARGVPTAPCN